MDEKAFKTIKCSSNRLEINQSDRIPNDEIKKYSLLYT